MSSRRITTSGDLVLAAASLAFGLVAIAFASTRSRAPFAFTPSLDGARGVRTRNDDKAAAAVPWTAFSIDAAADVFVAYDPRASARPDWMSGFEDTGEAIGL